MPKSIPGVDEGDDLAFVEIIQRNSKPIQNHVLEFKEGSIVVQSCDKECAHVGVFLFFGSKQASAYHHISIPDLKREYGFVAPWDLSPVIYDKFLADHKSELLEKINQLNEA